MNGNRNLTALMLVVNTKCQKAAGIPWELFFSSTKRRLPMAGGDWEVPWSLVFSVWGMFQKDCCVKSMNFGGTKEILAKFVLA